MPGHPCGDCLLAFAHEIHPPVCGCKCHGDGSPFLGLMCGLLIMLVVLAYVALIVIAKGTT